MNWQEFTRELDSIDWHDPRYIERQAPKVEALLAAVAADPALLRERTEQIVADVGLFAELVPHTNYPRTLMDKFVIYMDPDDRYRVRLHRFWPKRATGDVIEDIHDHKWNMSTVVLTGSYAESRFDVDHCDDATGTASVQLASARTLTAGDTTSLRLRIPHQITNQSMDEPCITLFVRGPSLEDHARIFDAEKGTFYKTFSPAPQIREGYLQMGRLNGVFHPIFAAR